MLSGPSGRPEGSHRREEGQVRALVAECGAESEQHTGGSGRQVHRQPQQFIPGKGEPAPVRHRVPGEVADLGRQPVGIAVMPGEVADDAGASGEETGLCVEG